MKTIVFLHIPKTAGQTVHAEIERAIGPDQTSPVRVHTQAAPDAQFPPGYRFFSGHLDWTELELMPEDRFVFTVLRNPGERIASFYFYLLTKANTLDDATLKEPHHTGLKMIKTQSADEYFFGGDSNWQRFIRDHYDNFYCSYFATQKMRGWMNIAQMQSDDLVSQAVIGSQKLTAIYSLDTLSRLEKDLLPALGKPVHLAGNRHNAGPQPQGEMRWPKLLARFEQDRSASLLERFVLHDNQLMNRINLR